MSGAAAGLWLFGIGAMWRELILQPLMRPARRRLPRGLWLQRAYPPLRYTPRHGAAR